MVEAKLFRDMNKHNVLNSLSSEELLQAIINCENSMEIIEKVVKTKDELIQLYKDRILVLEETKWIPISDWKKLPVGQWLVKVINDVRPYQVAYVNNNSHIIVVGNHFHFDAGEVAAYCAFNCYEGQV